MSGSKARVLARSNVGDARLDDSVRNDATVRLGRDREIGDERDVEFEAAAGQADKEIGAAIDAAQIAPGLFAEEPSEA